MLLPSVQHLLFLLLLCKHNTSKKKLSFFLPYLCNSGLASHPPLGNYLVSFLSSDAAGAMADAQKVFDNLSCRSHSSYNSMIIGYIKCGELQKAVDFYQTLEEGCFSVHLNEYAFVAILKACTKLKDAERGSRIHVQIARRGFLESNAILGTALVDMYCNCGMLKKAREVFEKLPEHDVVAWTSLISGYAQHNQSNMALVSFQLMLTQGICPSSATFVCVLKACGDVGDEDKGFEIHVEVVRKGLLKTNALVGNALVDMYAKCGSLVRAQEVFDMLANPDIVAWTSLISGYAQYDHSEDALNCFSQMQEQGISPDVVTLVCILKACGSCRAIEKGIEVHAELARKQVVKENAVVGTALVDMYAKCGELLFAQEVFEKLPIRSIDSWNALITGYAQQNRGVKVLECFEQMLSQGLCPDDVTLACYLKACGNTGAIDKGRKLHADIEKGLPKTNQIVCNALLDMYAKCGMLVKAEEVFDKLDLHDVTSWNVLIAGYGQAGKFVDVVNAFDRMMSEGVKPNASTFVNVLDACNHASLLERGKNYFEVMSVTFRIMPTLDHYTCMVHLLAHAGELHKAEEMMEKISSPLDIVMLLGMLKACLKWSNVELGRRTFEKAVQLDANEVAAYVCMESIYASVGMHDKAKKIKAMRKKMAII